MFHRSFVNNHRFWVYLGAMVIAVFLLGFPEDVFADDFSEVGGELPYEDFLENLKKSVTGPFAMVVSLVGLVVAGGVLIFGGDLNGFFRSLLFLVLAISMIVGGAGIVEDLQGAELVSLQSGFINTQMLKG